MKRLLVLLLVIVMCLACFASCDKLPDSVMDKLDPILDKVGLGSDDEPEHEHEFVLTSTKKGTCQIKGEEIYTCSCGEVKTVELSGEHKYMFIKEDGPYCTKAGTRTYMCENCGSQKIETFGEPTGHNLADFVEYSRIIPCTNDNCSYGVFPEGNGKYKETIVFKFTEADVDRFDAIYAEMEDIFESADKYDKTLHAYELGSVTHDAYIVMETKYEELYDVLKYITAQYQIAQIEFHIDTADTEKVANLENITEIRTELVARFYSFSDDIADSMFREYYYYGMSDDEINAYVAESDTVSNPEYTALVDRNAELERTISSMGQNTIINHSDVPLMYAEFVENSQKIAAMFNYSNYMEYAYENVYGRDYSYTDVQPIYDYVKTYIAPIFVEMTKAGIGRVDSDYTTKSFFEMYDQNKSLNDYIDVMNINAGKNVSFSDEFNKLMGDGNCFRGSNKTSYNGAYVTSLYGMGESDGDLPIAYFSDSYSSFFTVAHEFGHYINEVYSGGKYSQSYDLLEMHSQGNEMLFLAYLNNHKDAISASGLSFLNENQPYEMLSTIVASMSVDAFEQAVYTNIYDGPYADKIMANGTIDADEYDLLYKGILEELGVAQIMNGGYWRLMTITSPCYYVSYAVSAASVLQLLPMGIEDFDAASEAYLKLFSYVDEYETGADYMTTEETLDYAGLISFKDEELYIYINEYLVSMLEK